MVCADSGLISTPVPPMCIGAGAVGAVRQLAADHLLTFTFETPNPVPELALVYHFRTSVNTQNRPYMIT
jgi:hypothetical protein